MEELPLWGHSTFHQWGLWSGQSTSYALTTIIIDDWLKSIKSVCSVFLDVQKAFDSVPHTKLVAYADDLILYKPVESNADYNN